MNAGPAALLVAVLVALGGGLVVALGSGPVLRRLPEPPDPVPGKPSYATLATPRLLLSAAALATVGGLAVTVGRPPALWPPGLLLATLGVLLAIIDGRTTYLPAVLARAGWLLAVVAVGVALLLGSGWPGAGRTLAGGVLAGVFFALVWRSSRGGLAFGDVRLAPLIGVAGAASSWADLLLALLLGTLAPAVHGLARRLRGRTGPFPYGPGLVAGALLSLPISSWLT